VPFECSGQVDEKAGEPATVCALILLDSGQFLQLFGEVAPADGQKDGLSGGVEGGLEYLFDFDEGQTVPLVAEDVVDEDGEDIVSRKLLRYRLGPMRDDKVKRL
jgi:hypothetical protein